MNHEDSTISSTTPAGTTMTSPSSRPGLDGVRSSVLDGLIQQCRVDLQAMDSLLFSLETADRRYADDRSADSDRQYSITFTGEITLAINHDLVSQGADTIRRFAERIESLYRAATLDCSHEMISCLQSRMARCLRFLPVHSSDGLIHAANGIE